MKCINCDLESVYDSPDNLCEPCWIEWMVENNPDDPIQLTEKQQEQIRDELRSQTKVKSS